MNLTKTFRNSPDGIELTRMGADRAEAVLLDHPQIPIPLTELFAPGCYLREVDMPADTWVIGHRHKTKHFNIVVRGRVSVLMDGLVHHIDATEHPVTFVSEAGVRKVLYIHERCIWQTVHPTNETNPKKLKEELVVESDTFQEHQARIEQEKLRAVLQLSSTNKVS